MAVLFPPRTGKGGLRARTGWADWADVPLRRFEAACSSQRSALQERDIVNAVPAALNAEFATLCAAYGCPSIAPERPLRAALIQIPFAAVRNASLACSAEVVSATKADRADGVQSGASPVRGAWPSAANRLRP